MKLRNPILEVALMLILTLTVLTIQSFSEANFSILSLDIKKAPIKQFLTEEIKTPAKTPDSITAGKIAAKDSSHKKFIEPPRVMDSTPQRILMVGESMIEGLMFPFRKYGKYNGHTITAKIWYGSRLLDWGAKDTLKKLIAIYKPTFIIVSIGSNELFIRNIDEREPFVKNIVAQLGNSKFIWVGPPNPKKDNGINDLIMRNVGKDRFFVSKYMHFLRKRDGVHPKAEQCYKWADSISDWIMAKSRYPILLKRPYDSTGKMLPPMVRNSDTTGHNATDTLKKSIAVKPHVRKRKLKSPPAKQAALTSKPE